MSKPSTGLRKEDMNERFTATSYADVLMMWTNAFALIIVGIVSFDESIAIGRIILLLGILSALNEGLKLCAVRRGGVQPVYRKVRLGVTLSYVVLILLSVVALIIFARLRWPL